MTNGVVSQWCGFFFIAKQNTANIRTTRINIYMLKKKDYHQEGNQSYDHDARLATTTMDNYEFNDFLQVLIP